MKSMMFYEAEDEKNPQSNTLLREKEVFEKIKEIAQKKWGKYRDWTFDRWWNECWEDLWLHMKKDEKILTSTKIVTSMLWFEKNQGVEKIYSDMEKLVDEFLAQWHKDNPEPENMPELLLNEEEVLQGVIDRIEEKE